MRLLKKAICCLGMIAILSSFLGQNLLVEAANIYRNTGTKSQLFAVPEGGWSSVYVEVSYTEKYNVSGNRITLYERSKCVSFLRAYATSCPTISLGNVRHSNDTYFTSWRETAVIYDSDKWDGCSNWVNEDSVTYNKDAGITGNLPYVLACSGAVPAMASGSVELSFN